MPQLRPAQSGSTRAAANRSGSGPERPSDGKKKPGTKAAGVLSRLPRIRFASSGQGAALSASSTFYFILVPALFLGVFGLMMAFSATSVLYIEQGVNPYRPFVRTVIIAVVSLVVAALCAFVPPRLWDRISFPLYVSALLMQFMLIPFGITQGGNTNWLPIPGTGQSIQPSEFLKLATCLIIARVLASNSINAKDGKQVTVWVGLPALLAMLSVIIGQDLGTALVFIALTVGALWMSGAPLRWFGYMGVVGSAALVFLVSIRPSRVRRVLEYLPGYRSAPSTSAPTQTDHGLWALGSGGLTGVGPGASREKWNYLQEAHTDFILAIVGEEFGLIGTLTLLIVFAALIFGIFQMAANTTSGFIRVASGAIGSWVLAQTLINVGTVIGLVPVIGVPFPLVSYGGSSFLFTAMAIGVLLSFARYDVKQAAVGSSQQQGPKNGKAR